jgi:hemolysin III
MLQVSSIDEISLIQQHHVDTIIVSLDVAQHVLSKTNPNQVQIDAKIFVSISSYNYKESIQLVETLDCTKLSGFFVKHVDETVLNKLNLKLREIEANHKLAFGELSVIASIDSLDAFLKVANIANYARVIALFVDEQMIQSDITFGQTSSLLDMRYLKERLVLETARYHKTIIHPYFTDMNSNQLTSLRQIGYGGIEVRTHVDITNAHHVFSPSIEEIDYAKLLLDTEYNALMKGDKYVMFDGKRLTELQTKKARIILSDALVLGLFSGEIPPRIKRHKIQKEKTLPTKFYSLGEEIANAISHGAGAILGIVALIFLIFKGIENIDQPRYIVSGVVFGLSIFMLYIMSTLYHSMPLKRSAKQVFRRFDHASIYILIAGSYTPFILLLLEGAVGLYVAVVMWTLAIIGITMKVIWIKKFAQVHLALYIALGWLPVMFFINQIGLLGTVGLGLLIAGGVSYTVGVIFYALKLFKFTHMVWHLFCIVGTLLHFLTVLLYL